MSAYPTAVFRVYARYPELLAEMYAYSMAAAHENLPHFTVLHLMVSNTDADDEGWAHIDALGDDVCQPPDENGIFYPGKLMPTVLHYCQFFRIGEIGFQKRRIKKTIFNCDEPLLVELPLNSGTVRYKNRDGEIIKYGPKQGRRNAFMLCAIHRSINSMLMYYKTRMCPGTGSAINTNKTINLVDGKYWK